MNAADRNQLIEIRIDCADGSFEVCTGYPVQRDLILTARHGLYPKNCPANAAIKLRRYHLRAESFSTVKRCEVVWESESLDAALIRCDFANPPIGWRHLSPLRPIHGESWASEGFPKGADQSKNETSAFPIGGTLHGAANDAKRFHLELPENFESPHDWGGISGAPVFVRGQIVGLVVSTPLKAKGRLKAVFSADLFDDEIFASVIGYEREAGRVAALQFAAAECLKQSLVARECLGRVLATAETDSDKLAARIIALPAPETVIKTIKEAHARAASDRQAASTLRKLILIALPARFDTRIVEAIRIDMADRQRPVLSPPISTSTAAELAMAGVDGQPAEFKDAQATDDEPIPYPDGLFTFDHPPRLGMNDEVEDDYFKNAWNQHLINKFVTRKHRGRIDQSRLIEDAANNLKLLAEETKRSHYVLLFDSGSDQDNARSERRAGLIRKDCPSLVFLRLSNDGDCFTAETSLLRPFCRFLALSSKDSP